MIFKYFFIIFAITSINPSFGLDPKNYHDKNTNIKKRFTNDFSITKTQLSRLEMNLEKIYLTGQEKKSLINAFSQMDKKSVEIFCKQINDLIEMPIHFKNKDYLMRTLDPTLLNPKSVGVINELFDSTGHLSELSLIKKIISSTK